MQARRYRTRDSRCSRYYSAGGLFGQSAEPVETIRVESDLVDLKVSVVSLILAILRRSCSRRISWCLKTGSPRTSHFLLPPTHPSILFCCSIFQHQATISSSSSGNQPVDLLRQRDPQTAFRSSLFLNEARLVCPLTQDRRLLKKSIDNIEKPQGGTKFWDSLRYVLAILNASGNSLRRSAVVVMTDGVDNALPEVFGDGSQTSFDKLLQIVRESDAIVFPIYLDTEEEEYKRTSNTAKRVRNCA